MQWIIPSFSKIFTIRSIIWALSFVLYSAILLPVAVADDSATLQQIEANTSHLSGMATVQSEIQSVLDELNTRTRTNLPYLNYLPTVSRNIEDIETLIRNLNIPDYSSTLSTMSSNLSGLKSANHTDLSALKTALQNIYARQNNQTGAFTSGFNQVSNLLEKILLKSGGGQDVLAGNPWWATNSAFALTLGNYRLAYPDDGDAYDSSFSFPQFMSKWSAKLSAPAGSGSLTPATAMQLWGLASFRSWGQTGQQGFTWFDWMADAMRSNLTVQVSMHDYVSTNVTASDLQSFAASDTTQSDSLPSTNSLADLNLSLGSLEGNPFEEFQNRLDSVLPSLDDSGSANIVVIPEMTIGGIHVPIGQGDFLFSPSGAVKTLSDFVKLLISWAWRVLTMLGLFTIVRSEWGYWSTLGGASND